MTQLLLFEEPLEGKLLKEVKDLKSSLDRVRKAQFAKIGQLRKDYDHLKHEFEILKSAMCRTVTTVDEECKIVGISSKC